MCDCIANLNELLKPENARLQSAIVLPRDGTPGYVVPYIATERIEKRRDGKSAPSVAPTFCPFCGQRYVPEASADPEDAAHG